MFFLARLNFIKKKLLNMNAVHKVLGYRRIKSYCIVLYCIVHQLTPEEGRHRGTDIGRACRDDDYRRYVNEDHSQWVMTRRKQLLPKTSEARERGKVAYLSFDKLVVKDKLGQAEHNTAD